MRQPRTKIAHTLADKTLKSGVSKRLSREIAAYLISEKRVNELDSFLRDIQVDWAEAGYVEVTAASCHPLTSEIRSEITRQVKKLFPNAKHIQLSETIAPAVIGGVRLNLANQQLDLSVESELNKFKQLTIAGRG